MLQVGAGLEAPNVYDAHTNDQPHGVGTLGVLSVRRPK